jgi:hypothetical protein
MLSEGKRCYISYLTTQIRDIRPNKGMHGIISHFIFFKTPEILKII